MGTGRISRTENRKRNRDKHKLNGLCTHCSNKRVNETYCDFHRIKNNEYHRKHYLKTKADDTMNTYKLERKKYVETLSTYSDIYTAILIAAPLLFIIVLVMISIIGNKIGNLEIGFIQKLGTFVIVPALNIGFIFFMNIVQPDL